MELPTYIKTHCNNTRGKVIACDYYLHEVCPNTCAFALDIMGDKFKSDNYGNLKYIEGALNPAYQNNVGISKTLEELDNGGLKL